MKELNCNLPEFRDYITKHKCMCFGAGLQARRIICILDNWGLTEQIIAFIDNNSQKQGSVVKELEYSYPVLSLNEATERIEDDDFLLITATDVVGIREQLDRESTLKDIYVTSLAQIAQNQLLISDYDEIKKEHDTPVIPKKIHYCWFGGEIPAQIKKNIDGWKRICPDYEIICWNESNYDVTKNTYMYEAYKRKAWGFVTDYIRLDIIYNYGGIYLDTDIELLKRPDELLYQDAFAVLDGTFLLDTGGGFGARAKLEIIKSIRDYYDDVSFDTDDRIPCTTHQYRFLRRRLRVNDSVQSIGGLNIYPMIVPSTNVFFKQIRKSDKAFWIHYGTATWLDGEYIKQREQTKFVENANIKQLERYDK